MHGGGHEFGLRSGTVETHQVAALGEAARRAAGVRAEEYARIEQLSSHFLDALGALPGWHLNGSGASRVPHIMNITFDGVDGGALMADLAWRGRGLAVSSGAACSTATREPSHVLRALGLTEAQVEASVRFSLGRPTTQEEVDAAAWLVIDSVTRLRRISPLWVPGAA
jgi:cysteine desulfurase